VNRSEIVRSDFPASRKGYDRDAVDAHLRRLADEVERLHGGGPGVTPVADAASEQVAKLIAAAEQVAAELEREARARAEEIIAEARRDAGEEISRAQAAVSGLAQQAEDLRQRVGSLGSGISERPASAEIQPEPGPVTVPEPTVPAPEVDPSPIVVPEPEPPREPEPAPDPVPDPIPEPQQPDELPPAAGSEAGARLVAMKMALEGSSREEVERHLAGSYKGVDTTSLLDDVFARLAS
jgi:DivIVA domain-containing protein